MMEQSVKLIIFDLDGTLVDAYRAVASSLNHALDTFGLPRIDDHIIQRNVGWGEKALVSRFVPEEKLEAVLSVYREHHKSALKSGTKFLPGARKLLDELKRNGFVLAIASNRPSRFTHIILKHLGVLDHFSMVVCADQVREPKPSADVIENILKRSGIAGSQSLYVGDMTIDVETGKRAGVKVIAVASGSHTREELEEAQPSGVIDRVDELAGLLKERL